MSGPGAAFAKGGCGCLIAFFVIGVLTLIVGGRVQADACGLIGLFIIGGVVGLIAWAIYQKGKQDGQHGDHGAGQHDDIGFPPHRDDPHDFDDLS